MTIVLDASAMVEFVLGSAKGAQVRMLIETHGTDMHAPEVVIAECLSALRSLERRTHIVPSRANQAAADMRSVPLVLYPTAPFADRIWGLRGRFTVYDAHYVALSEGLGVPLITGDLRLANAAADLVQLITV